MNKSLPLMWGGPVIDDVETVGTVLRRDAGAGEEDGVGYIKAVDRPPLDIALRRFVHRSGTAMADFV